MWTYQHSVETSAPADAVFAFYRDVDRWPEWDSGLDRMELDGPFVAGTTGRMVLAGQDPLPWRLVWVEDGRGFEDETDIPGAGAVVRVRHFLESLSSGGTRVNHSLTVDGPAADEIGPTIGPQITADFPVTMAALVARAEAAHERG
jgi:hypothetical protein